MDTNFRDTTEDYRKKGFANRSGYGNKPVLLIVDFINGFTDPTSPLGGDFAPQLAVTNQLLSEFRQRGLPIVYTTVVYDSPDFSDAGIFIKKVPSLRILTRGSRMVEVDSRIQGLPGELLVEKKYASAFFGTNLDSYLRGLGVDTVIMTGCTTSGCIRASAVDSLQHGFYTVVVRDGVGDRPEGTHEANLLDIDAKYGDVVSIQEVLQHLQKASPVSVSGGNGSDDFTRWWNEKRG